VDYGNELMTVKYSIVTFHWTVDKTAWNFLLQDAETASDTPESLDIVYDSVGIFLYFLLTIDVHVSWKYCGFTSVAEVCLPLNANAMYLLIAEKWLPESK